MEKDKGYIKQSVTETFIQINKCRLCDGKDVKEITDFGDSPVADVLCSSPEEETIKIPLTLGYCIDCSLVQINETINPRIVFNEDYPYYSSVSPKLMQYFKSSAFDIMNRFRLNDQHAVIEVGSNDGYMLKYFKEKGISTLGVDPSGPTLTAQRLGIETIMDFFSKDIAVEIRKKYPDGFDILLANNVLAHDADINSMIEGISIVLNKSGTAIVEVPYVCDLISKNEFDTIYHQHIFYFSLTSLDRAFRKHHLFINDLQRTSIHGGTLRLFIQKEESLKSSVMSLHAEEERLGVEGAAYYESFHNNILKVKSDINELLSNLKSDGKRIAAYAAAAKSVSFLSYTGIDHHLLEYVVDLNPYKLGKYLPGSGIPILPVSKIMEDFPDYVLILAWNFAEEIIEQQQAYLERGGKFILAIPGIQIIE